ATSAMAVAPSCHLAEAQALASLNATKQRVAIGLHVTLTAPFVPLTRNFAPLRDGKFPPLASLLMLSMQRRLKAELLAAEVAALLRTFVDHLGRPPDFIDGHQHVHLFPQIRDAVLHVAQKQAPGAWVRQCGNRQPFVHRLGDPKGLLIDALSRSFCRRAAAR